jgi:hypothetical protein
VEDAAEPAAQRQPGSDEMGLSGVAGEEEAQLDDDEADPTGEVGGVG